MFPHIHIEQTPNPEAMKFSVSENLVYSGNTYFFETIESATKSPLAVELFKLNFVNSVFLGNNFITIGKKQNFQWDDIILILEKIIADYLNSGKTVIEDATVQEPENEADPLISKIKMLLNDYVRPAVERDGGAISFKTFENGKVTLILRGACSGCPSSIVTLKAGIEGLMTRMIPEVKEVVAE
ncbi:MAG: thioredoxin, partial [Bacteroidetes bacterium RIFCSPLOWO2_02_FULL_36_8]